MKDCAPCQEQSVKETLLREIVETGCIFLQPDGSCTCVNNSTVEFLNRLIRGNSEGKIIQGNGLFAVNLKDYVAKEDIVIFEEHLCRCSQAQDYVSSVIGLQAADGSKYYVQLNSTPKGHRELAEHGGYPTFLLDISSLQGLKDIINRLEELNVIGKIAGSVAHEVRNPLTVVRGHLQLLSWDESLKNHYDKLDTMIMEIDRAVEILSELLYMSSPSQLKLERENINKVLNNLYQLLNAEALVNQHEVEYNLNDVPHVLLDKKRFRQVVLNLVRNGLQAMEQHSKIVISTYARDKKVYFSVRDFGKGIPQEVLKKLGTPFLTTKADGTGLGLTSCYNIVSQHEASMEVDTGPEGTTFTVIFNEA